VTILRCSRLARSLASMIRSAAPLQKDLRLK
jgi:hypothetical protein